MRTLASLPKPVLIPYIVCPVATAPSTSSRLRSKASRAAGSTRIRARGSRATRTTSATVRERPSRTQSGSGMAEKSLVDGRRSKVDPRPGARLLRLSVHEELRISRIRLERPIENEEGLAHVGHAQGAVPRNAVGGAHL